MLLDILQITGKWIEMAMQFVEWTLQDRTSIQRNSI